MVLFMLYFFLSDAKSKKTYLDSIHKLLKKFSNKFTKKQLNRCQSSLEDRESSHVFTTLSFNMSAKHVVFPFTSFSVQFK